MRQNISERIIDNLLEDIDVDTKTSELNTSFLESLKDLLNKYCRQNIKSISYKDKISTVVLEFDKSFVNINVEGDSNLAIVFDVAMRLLRS